MTTVVPLLRNLPSTVVSTIPTKADAGRLKHFLTSWGGIAEPLPAQVTELIPPALAKINTALRPIEDVVLAGLMQRLWDAGVPQPKAVTLKEWRRLLSPIPADVIAMAFDEVIRSHRWPDPPKIADVIRFVQPEIDRRRAWKRKLELAATRLRLDQKASEEAKIRHQVWMRNQTPEQAAFLQEIRAKSGGQPDVGMLIKSLKEKLMEGIEA